MEFRKVIFLLLKRMGMVLKILVSLFVAFRQVEEYFLPRIIQEVTGQVKNKKIITIIIIIILLLTIICVVKHRQVFFFSPPDPELTVRVFSPLGSLRPSGHCPIRRLCAVHKGHLHWHGDMRGAVEPQEVQHSNAGLYEGALRGNVVFVLCTD